MEQEEEEFPNIPDKEKGKEKPVSPLERAQTRQNREPTMPHWMADDDDLPGPPPHLSAPPPRSSPRLSAPSPRAITPTTDDEHAVRASSAVMKDAAEVLRRAMEAKRQQQKRTSQSAPSSPRRRSYSLAVSYINNWRSNNHSPESKTRTITSHTPESKLRSITNTGGGKPLKNVSLLERAQSRHQQEPSMAHWASGMLNIQLSSDHTDLLDGGEEDHNFHSPSISYTNQHPAFLAQPLFLDLQLLQSQRSSAVSSFGLQSERSSTISLSNTRESWPQIMPQTPELRLSRRLSMPPPIIDPDAKPCGALITSSSTSNTHRLPLLRQGDVITHVDNFPFSALSLLSWRLNKTGCHWLTVHRQTWPGQAPQLPLNVLVTTAPVPNPNATRNSRDIAAVRSISSPQIVEADRPDLQPARVVSVEAEPTSGGSVDHSPRSSKSSQGSESEAFPALHPVEKDKAKQIPKSTPLPSRLLGLAQRMTTKIASPFSSMRGDPSRSNSRGMDDSGNGKRKKRSESPQTETRPRVASVPYLHFRHTHAGDFSLPSLHSKSPVTLSTISLAANNNAMAATPDSHSKNPVTLSTISLAAHENAMAGAHDSHSDITHRNGSNESNNASSSTTDRTTPTSSLVAELSVSGRDRGSGTSTSGHKNDDDSTAQEKEIFDLVLFPPSSEQQKLLRQNKLHAARSAFKENDFETARDFLLEAHGLEGSEEVNKLLKKVEAEIQADKVFAHLSPQIIRLKREGLSHFKKGRYTQAVYSLTQALELADDALLYYERARCYLKMMMNEQALADMHTAARLDPGSEAVQTMLGLTYLKLRRFAEAQQASQRAQDLRDENEEKEKNTPPPISGPRYVPLPMPVRITCRQSHLPTTDAAEKERKAQEEKKKKKEEEKLKANTAEKLQVLMQLAASSKWQPDPKVSEEDDDADALLLDVDLEEAQQQQVAQQMHASPDRDTEDTGDSEADGPRLDEDLDQQKVLAFQKGGGGSERPSLIERSSSSDMLTTAALAAKQQGAGFERQSLTPPPPSAVNMGAGFERPSLIPPPSDMP